MEGGLVRLCKNDRGCAVYFYEEYGGCCTCVLGAMVVVYMCVGCNGGGVHVCWVQWWWCTCALGAMAVVYMCVGSNGGGVHVLWLIHISEPTRQAETSYAVFCLKKKKEKKGLYESICG